MVVECDLKMEVNVNLICLLINCIEVFEDM